MNALSALGPLAIGLVTLGLLPSDGPAQHGHSAQRPAGDGDPGRWVRLLELPSRRGEAFAQIWAAGPAANTALRVALQDPRDAVRAQAARALAWVRAEKTTIPQLEALDAAGDSPASSQAAIALVAQRHRGRTAVLQFNLHKLSWVNADGECELIHKFDDTTYDAEVLRDGGVLAAAGQAVIEWGPDGVERWRSDHPTAAIDADRLANGHTLVADRGLQSVFEIDQTGKVCWEFTATDAGTVLVATEAERTPSGNTIICNHTGAQAGGGVLEVAPDGTIVQRFECDSPSDADRTFDGGWIILAGTEPKLMRFAADGTPRGHIRLGFEANEIDPLPDGGVLVGAHDGLVRLAADGSVCGTIDIPGEPAAVQIMVEGVLPDATVVAPAKDPR